MRQHRNGLSDPERAVRAWARYRWIMRWVIAAAMLSVLAALVYLKLEGATFTVAVVIATVAGVTFSVLLAGGLMGLMFMSSGTGHDEDAARPDLDDPDRRRPPK